MTAMMQGSLVFSCLSLLYMEAASSRKQALKCLNQRLSGVIPLHLQAGVSNFRQTGAKLSMAIF